LGKIESPWRSTVPSARVNIDRTESARSCIQQSHTFVSHDSLNKRNSYGISCIYAGFVAPTIFHTESSSGTSKPVRGRLNLENPGSSVDFAALPIFLRHIKTGTERDRTVFRYIYTFIRGIHRPGTELRTKKAADRIFARKQTL
jgi:hypothetical protein